MIWSVWLVAADGKQRFRVEHLQQRSGRVLELPHRVVKLGRRVAAMATRPGGHGGYAPARLDDAVRRLKDASAPLLQVLDPETLLAVRGDQPD